MIWLKQKVKTWPRQCKQGPELWRPARPMSMSFSWKTAASPSEFIPTTETCECWEEFKQRIKHVQNFTGCALLANPGILRYRFRCQPGAFVVPPHNGTQLVIACDHFCCGWFSTHTILTTVIFRTRVITSWGEIVQFTVRNIAYITQIWTDNKVIFAIRRHFERS